MLRSSEWLPLHMSCGFYWWSMWGRWIDWTVILLFKNMNQSYSWSHGQHTRFSPLAWYLRFPQKWFFWDMVLCSLLVSYQHPSILQMTAVHFSETWYPSNRLYSLTSYVHIIHSTTIPHFLDCEQICAILCRVLALYLNSKNYWHLERPAHKISPVSISHI